MYLFQYALHQMFQIRINEVIYIVPNILSFHGSYGDIVFEDATRPCIIVEMY
jgi:hypothetical protein